MQMSLDLDARETPLATVRRRLSAEFGAQAFWTTPVDPPSQLVRAMIGTRTKDSVSWDAFMTLAAACPDWATAAQMSPAEVEAMIGEVTHAHAKARRLPLALRLIRIKRGDFDLDFLADHPVEQAVGWLTQLPGVGAKVAACVLNFSRLRMRALVVDTHVYRVARRLGLIAWGADAPKAYGALMNAAPADWGPDDLFEMHWLLKRLGQHACTHAEPRCRQCPLTAVCPKRGVEGATVVGFRPPPSLGS